MSTDLATLPDREKVYSESTSIFFKHTHVFRIVDKKRNTLIYVAISDCSPSGPTGQIELIA